MQRELESRQFHGGLESSTGGEFNFRTVAHGTGSGGVVEASGGARERPHVEANIVVLRRETLGKTRDGGTASFYFLADAHVVCGPRAQQGKHDAFTDGPHALAAIPLIFPNFFKRTGGNRSSPLPAPFVNMAATNCILSSTVSVRCCTCKGRVNGTSS